MGRKPGRTKRFIQRFFKERQIYHRSDGVVHFISMSTRTQMALAMVITAGLAWVAYASVNVVFKEQIIMARERDSRIMETTYANRLQQAHRSYNDVSELNVIMQAEFDEAMSEISNRHQTLKSMVDRKASIDHDLETLKQGLAVAGYPDGQKPKNGNRVMIDVTSAEPTPRQSRISQLRREAEREARIRMDQSKLPAGTDSAEALNRLVEASADLYVQQVLLLATIEERAAEQISEMTGLFNATGITLATLLPERKISNTVLAQGGPYIDAGNVADASTAFFRHANRVGLLVDELNEIQTHLGSTPIASPLVGSRRFTSGFGIRRDPINGRSARHRGIDFAAPWASPVTSTAPGVVKFAGNKAGFGRVVEVQHANGFVTRYAHLNRYVVKPGEKVELHQKIGELGKSGRSTGPHVHYEVLFRGRQVNPQRFIETGRYVFES